MKNLFSISIRITFLLVSLAYCTPTSAQLKVSGYVDSDEKYEVRINALFYDSIRQFERKKWVDWDVWEHQNNYLITVQAGDTVEAHFIRYALSSCADTTRVFFIGTSPKLHIDTNIRLDGSIHVLKRTPLPRRLQPPAKY